MEENPQLAELLDMHLGKASMGEARLARLVNETTGISTFLHRSTVRNWRTGVSRSVNDWRKLTAMATVLRLDESEADALLASGGCPPLKELAANCNESNRQFLIYWENRSKQNSVTAQPRVGRTFSATGSQASVIPTQALGALFAVGLIAIGILWVIQSAEGKASTRNQLLNPRFESGSADWVTYINSSATAQFSTSKKTMQVTVVDKSDKIWHISFFQPDLEITTGESYVLGFRVRGEQDNIFTVDVTRNHDPKTSTAPNQVRKRVTVTEEWETHTIEFVAQDTVLLEDGGARVLFELGHSEPGEIWFDDIEFAAAE